MYSSFSKLMNFIHLYICVFIIEQNHGLVILSTTKDNPGSVNRKLFLIDNEEYTVAEN